MRAVILPDDLPEINLWMRGWDKNNIQAQMVPPQGFIEPGVACGFMISTNSHVAFLEYFIVNPKAGKVARMIALDTIADLLIKAAHGGGVLQIYAMSSHPTIYKLCEKHKFKALPLKVFGRG